MKQASFANRGRPFEELLNLAHNRYQTAGIACVHKIPTEFLPLRDGTGRVVNCKVEHKSCVDYLGRYRNIPVAVEAKHTDGKRISFDRVEPHQADYTDDFCREPGAVGIVVVSFGMSRFFAVPWQFWKAARDEWAAHHKRGVRTAVEAYRTRWCTPGAASVSPEQLMEAWEIRPGGAYALPYLQIVERLAEAERGEHNE